MGVYPRVYGETDYQKRLVHRRYGLSPRVRGNLSPTDDWTHVQRSIPACTGKPLACLDRPSGQRVYPRVYGETHEWSTARTITSGLSPRVRGNPPGVSVQPAHLGSIPACTGKPARCQCAARPSGVYPRVYGETRARV